jgi:hypothetical protein
MVSGLVQDEQGENVTIRNLAGNKSQSAISIPTTYQYYTNTNPSNPQEGTSCSYFPPGTANCASTSAAGSRGTLPHPSRSSRVVGPGYYYRTLSSSSLLTNKSSVAKSRSDYCSVGVGPSAFSERAAAVSGGVVGSGGNSNPPPINFRRGVYHHPISGSSNDIIYIDNNVEESGPGPFLVSSANWGNPRSRDRDRDRDFLRERDREQKLIRDSQPIIINVPITAPKATATTLSRATSPPPPQFTTSPKKTLESRSKVAGGVGAGGNETKGQQITGGGIQSRSSSRYHHPKNSNEDRFIGGNEGSPTNGTRKDSGEGQEETCSIVGPEGNQGPESSSIKIEIETHHTKAAQKSHLVQKTEDGKVLIEGRRKARVRRAKYVQNAPLKRLKHPLEENIFSSLLITLLAVGVALVVGIPVLCLTGAFLILAVTIRYSLYILHGCYSYIRFFCSNRRRSHSSPSNNRHHHHSPNNHHIHQHHHHHDAPPKIFPRDRLAFANDVRWLGKKKPRRCQSILHTLLVFEGTMDLPSLRHLVQTRVLHAETNDGELAYPRLLQKILSLPAGFQWQLDVTFDIQNHIFLGPSHIRTEAQLQEYLSLLVTESLPMEKPLWEIRVLSNYGAQRDTIAILRVHQCLADGMSLVRILSHSLADHSQMHIPVRPHFAGLSFSFNFIRSLIVGPLTLFMWIFTTFKDKNLFSLPLNQKNNRHSFKDKNNRKVKDEGEQQSDEENGNNSSEAYVDSDSQSGRDIPGESDFDKVSCNLQYNIGMECDINCAHPR